MKKRQTRHIAKKEKKEIRPSSEQSSYDNFLDWLIDSPDSDQKTDSGSELGVFEVPSSDALDRLEAIPLLNQTADDVPGSSGSVMYDSWEGSAPAMRDIIPGHLRRVQLKAGKVTLEIVAERQKDEWEFVARVYQGDNVRHDFVIKVGRKKLLAKSGGFFHWTSKSVPRMVELLSYNRNLTFEELTW